MTKKKKIIHAFTESVSELLELKSSIFDLMIIIRPQLQIDLLY